VVVLAVLLPSTAWCIPHLGVICVGHNSNRIGAITHNSNRGNFSSNSRNNNSSNSSTVLLPTAIAGYHLASIAILCQQLSMLQQQEDMPLWSRMPPAQAKQLTVSSGTHGQPAEGPSEGSCTTDWPRQLHHRGGDSHGRRSVSGYVLSQLMSYYYSI
jgi:hypothetical protein